VKLITPQDVAAEGVPLLAAAVLVGNGVSLETFLQLEDIPADKRVLIAIRYLVRTDCKLLNDWLGDNVECAVRLHVLHCGVPLPEKWAAAWLDGKSWAHEQNGDSLAIRKAAWDHAAVGVAYVVDAAYAAYGVADADVDDVDAYDDDACAAADDIADADTIAHTDVAAAAAARQASFAWQLQAILHIIEGTP